MSHALVLAWLLYQGAVPMIPAAPVELVGVIRSFETEAECQKAATPPDNSRTHRASSRSSAAPLPLLPDGVGCGSDTVWAQGTPIYPTPGRRSPLSHYPQSVLSVTTLTGLLNLRAIETSQFGSLNKTESHYCNPLAQAWTWRTPCLDGRPA
jgi:hypothetical protein